MKPWELLARTEAPGGGEMTLMRRDREYVIFSRGELLMSSRMVGSETELAALACERAAHLDAPCVLVGGLGLGYTLRATLDLLPATATVVVAELVPAVVDWNRGPLAPLAGEPLFDPRVRVELGDVGALLLESRSRFDAVLLDVDNGPEPLVSSSSADLYRHAGLMGVRRALRPNGVLAVWSAFDDPGFVRRLRQAGFAARAARVRARGGRRGPRHTIFVATHDTPPA